MDVNNKSRLRVLLIGIALGISLGALFGFITGTFNLPVAVVVPVVVIPITYITILYLKKGREN
jgi:uncharacterized membrane protein (Fun14 family)